MICFDAGEETKSFPLCEFLVCVIITKKQKITLVIREK